MSESDYSVFSDNVDNAVSVSSSVRREEKCDGHVAICMILECTREVMCVRYSGDGNLLAAGQADGIIRIFNPETGQSLYSLTDGDTSKTNLPVTSLRFKPSQETDKTEHKHILLATYASGMVKFWHYPSSSCVHTINEPNKTTLASSINSIASKFLTAGSDTIINLYDMETKTLVNQLEPSDAKDQHDGHRMRIFALCYHPNHPNVFISGGWDDTVQFWDDRETHAFRKIYGPHICGDALDIDGYHNHVLTGSWRKDTPLQVWDFNSGDKIRDVPQDSLQSSQLYCCQWLGKDSIVCGGCDSNLAKVIDRGTLNTVGQLVDLPNGVFCIDNDRQGARPKIAVGANTKIWILRVDRR
jgi:WD40 repeat protein